MIFPKTPQTVAAVAAHYDELDTFYRDIWGEHVHHGYWATQHQPDDTAADALVDLLADRLIFTAGQTACDIGCGYAAAARRLAAHYDISITGVTVSAVQAYIGTARLQAAPPSRGHVSVAVQDWLSNTFPDAAFDLAYAIESSEHMADKQRFFDEAHRVLRPGGRLAVFVWLAADHPRPWEIRHLLEPICREGRLPSMGTEADYRAMAHRAHLKTTNVEDLTDRVSRTWSLCARRLVAKLLTQPSYFRFLIGNASSNRIFALTILRLLLAYRTHAMRYCLMVFERDAVT